MNIRKFIIGVLIVALLLMVGVALAQEETPAPFATNTPDAVIVVTVEPPPVVIAPEPTPIPDPQPGDDVPITTPGDLFNQVVQLLNGTYIFWAAAGVIVLTGLVKLGAQVVFKTAITGNAAAITALFFQVSIWIIYSIAAAHGQGDEFKAWYLRVIDVGKALLPLFGSLFVGQLGYQKAVKYDVLLAGYKPTARPKSNMIRG